MHTLGNISLLDREKTAFLCSRTLQSAGILPSLDWATSLNPQSDCVIGGFQSDLERDVLRFLLRKKIPVIIVLARSLYATLPEIYRQPIDEGRMLIISHTDAPRVSRANAHRRNLYVASQCRTLVIGCLPPQSSLNEIVSHSKNRGVEVKVLGEGE